MNIQYVIKAVKSGSWENSYDNKALDTFSRLKNELTIVNTDKGEILMHDNRIVIPHKLTDRVITLAHEGHQGIKEQNKFASSPVQLVGSVTVDSENILSLKQNHREVYRQLGKILDDNDIQKLQAWHGLDTRLKLGERIATFNDVVVSSDGWIVDSKYDLAVRNGGCQTTTNLLVRKFLVTRYRSVITIAARWCEGIWHFPMEALVGLVHITDYNKQNSFIHVSEKNEWVMQWLKLIGVNKNRVIHGTISADTLIVPQMAKCGSPSLDQLQWLRKSIPLKVSLNKHSILLIKRTRKRVMPNFDEIQSLVEKFAKEVNLDFVLHDDRSLPSLILQLERFSKASIVIGPHGAGMVNLIASKNRTCVIEFSPTSSNTSILVISGAYSETVEQAETCDDVDKTLCDEIFARKPDMCAESCITKLCKRSCGLCPCRFLFEALRCYSCHEVSDVTNCTTESACTSTEELCFTVQTFTDNFEEAYKLGCAKKSLCDSVSSKRKVNVGAGCCNSELCNNKPPTLLNVTDSQTLLTQNTTMNDTNMCDDIDRDICQKMLKMDANMCSDDCLATKLCPHMCGRCFHCLLCDEIDNPNNCNMTTTCANGKECFALETLTSEGMIAIKLGCMSKQVKLC
ncbi:unnamed protein product [Mytilus coruscus]|uniref:UPAR/Ly6 domain-containing protein n=1 Tax=Mytilus coruscus TaxID=42192 RepID=A0A6J8D9M8_MYTCO|nr:unnamed protein product [Mytilus coruscus]